MFGVCILHCKSRSGFLTAIRKLRMLLLSFYLLEYFQIHTFNLPAAVRIELPQSVRVSLFFATLVNDRYDSTEAKFSRQQLIKKYSIRTHQFCNPAFPINKPETRKIAQGSTDRIIHYQLLPTKSGFSAIISIVDQSCVHFLKNNDTLTYTLSEISK